VATTTRRYLVIANQTLAEAELGEAIRRRPEAGPSSFYLPVPNTDHGDLATRIARSAPHRARPRVAVLKDGELMQVNTPQSLFDARPTCLWPPSSGRRR
jgi:hypothetical protein